MSTRDPLAFLPGVGERLGYYVYALRDPRDGAIFYVGKGKGDRAYQHARHARKVDPSETRAQLKLGTIHAIHDAGLTVGVEILRHGIADEKTAYEVEAAVIDVLELTGAKLANVVGGRHDRLRGWRQLEEIMAGYAAEPVEIHHPVMLVRVSREFHRARSPEALYEATRKWWAISPKRHHSKWAFAVFDGIVRAVYAIDSWEQVPEGGRRWAFRGHRDAEMEELYIWKHVRDYLSTGAQNPIRYVNC
jgi:hypothetical protein